MKHVFELEFVTNAIGESTKSMIELIDSASTDIGMIMHVSIAKNGRTYSACVKDEDLKRLALTILEKSKS